ncbi:thiamine-phosphate kinase [Veillonella sp. 3310]|uniref:thiamine-phosphate kinase n=1 Tax=Veillonella sp. 3310 TaxID=2490956 RepID=UPI000FD6AC5C|nr:thiamine-phosphate kinase [Veillonella sp. 3310]
MHKDPFEEYIRQGESNQYEKAQAWKTAIGLQAVDGLTPSAYLVELAKKNIEGEMSLQALHTLLENYYESYQNPKDRTAEADIVSLRISELLLEKAFSFTPSEYLSIHRRLFTDIYPYAGTMRNYNMTKKEWILDGDTVTYGSVSELGATLLYDIEQEKSFSYANLDMSESIHHLATFVAKLWQIHVFGEGNTRTTAVFFIKYLRTLGFTVTNDMFANHAWYFRNALVRANYQNLKLGVYRTTEYLERFLRNVLLDEDHVLSNRSMHIHNGNGKNNINNTDDTNGNNKSNNNLRESSIEYTIDRDTMLQDNVNKDIKYTIESNSNVCKPMTPRLDEFALIDKLTQHTINDSTYVKVGVGDDCAVYDTPHDVDQLVSTDMMVEGVHFSESTTSPFDVGYRLGAANISDIAAMGGTPRHMVVSIAVPKERHTAYVEAVYNGLRNICADYDVNIIGGDTVSTEGPFVISATVFGDVPKHQSVLRSGAQDSDAVFITNYLGLSYVGLLSLLEGSKEYPVSQSVHQRPIPHVECGIIARDLGATSMNDISDGLSSELNEIAKASQVTIYVDESTLPIHPEVQAYCESKDMSPYFPMWTGGEDFQLVGTIPAEKADSLPSETFTIIGYVKAGSAQVLVDRDGQWMTVEPKGYNHLSKA